MYAVAAAIAGGLTVLGAAKGWKVESIGGSSGDLRRAASGPFHNVAFGLNHYHDIELHGHLIEVYGEMLGSHNTTLLSVTWLEKHPSANHTGIPLEDLDMTHGRILTLQDGGIIRTSVGHRDHLGEILESYDGFKGSYSTETAFSKRDYTVDWVSFNTYGENMRLAAADHAATYVKQTDATIAEEDSSRSQILDDAFARASWDPTGKYPTKYCLGLSPMPNSPGENSIIVGEVYYNQWGEIDEECKGA